MSHRHPQRGALSLLRVAVFSALLAAAAMAAMYSMRHERNLFAEAWDKAAGSVPAASATPAPSGGPLRKCVIDGKTVVSNVACKDSNKTARDIEIHETKGFEAPKQPAPVKNEPASNPALDKMIEKQLN